MEFHTVVELSSVTVGSPRTVNTLQLLVSCRWTTENDTVSQCCVAQSLQQGVFPEMGNSSKAEKTNLVQLAKC